MEVRRKAINIVLAMTSGRNVEEVVLFLKKQLQRTTEQEFDKVRLNDLLCLNHILTFDTQSNDYRQLLIQSIHICAIKFSEVAGNVVYALMDFLGEANNPSALDVVSFVR
jgi:coatomer subunit beta